MRDELAHVERVNGCAGPVVEDRETAVDLPLRFPFRMHSIVRFARAVLLLFLAVRSVAAQSSQTTIAPPPDSVASDVLGLLQSGDGAARSSWISRHLSVRAKASDSASSDRLLAALHLTGAPFTLTAAEPVGRHRFLKLSSARTGRSLTLDLATDRAEQPALGRIEVLESHAAIADSLVWPAQRPAGDDAAVSVVRDNLSRLARRGAFSGVAYVARGETVLLSQGFGMANREDGVANTPHTRFMLASMGKMFTATSILQLVDAGRLKLEDTLARVLPSYPNPDRALRITIRQLLQHSAGLGDLWSTPTRPVSGLTGQIAAAAEVAYPPLLFEPGTRWSYSNEGYVVLAAVVEQVSGEPFGDYVRHHVLDPSGMTETQLEAGVDDIVPFRAVGYRPADDDPLGAGALRANWSFLREHASERGASGAGGGYSTSGDIARFARALRTGRLISDSLRAEMWTGRWDLPGSPGQKYGFAQIVERIGDRVAAGHGGGGTGSGVDNGFEQFTDGSYVVIVLANMEPPAGGVLASAIIRLLGSPVKAASAVSAAR